MNEKIAKRAVDLTPFAGMTIGIRFHFTVGAEDRPFAALLFRGSRRRRMLSRPNGKA